MAADSEGGMGVGDGDGVVERGAVGHQRGGGEAPGGMEFCDSAIDARSEAEVVGVEDEACRRVGAQRSGGCMWRRIGTVRDDELAPISMIRRGRSMALARKGNRRGGGADIV